MLSATCYVPLVFASTAVPLWRLVAVRRYVLLVSAGGKSREEFLALCATPAGTAGTHCTRPMLPVQSTGNEESGSPLFVFGAAKRLVEEQVEVEVMIHVLVSVPKS